MSSSLWLAGRAPWLAGRAPIRRGKHAVEGAVLQETANAAACPGRGREVESPCAVIPGRRSTTTASQVGTGLPLPLAGEGERAAGVTTSQRPPPQPSPASGGGRTQGRDLANARPYPD